MIRTFLCITESANKFNILTPNCCVGTISSCEDYDGIFKAMSQLDTLGIPVTLKEIQQEVFNSEKHFLPTLIGLATASRLGLTY